jgi:hypothetical protein
VRRVGGDADHLTLARIRGAVAHLGDDQLH